MRLCGGIAGTALAVLLIAGCGGGGSDPEATTAAPAGPPREVRVTLAGKAGAQDLGIMTAEARQLFTDAGLRPVVASPAAPRRPVPYVLNGTDELGAALLPQVIEAKAKGAPLTVIGSEVAQPTMAMIWPRDSGFESIADLAGKTIAVPGIPVEEEFLRVMLEQAGLSLSDVEVLAVGYDLVPALLDGRADAIFGAAANVEGAELEALGEKPIVTPVQTTGAPDYEELVMIARGDTLAKDPTLASDFMGAVTAGATAAAEDPSGAFDTIEESAWASTEADAKTTRAQVEATLPLLSTTGAVDPDEVQDLVDWMAREGMIRKPFPASELIAEGSPSG